MKTSRAAQSRGDERTPGASGACDDPIDRLDLCAGGSRGMTTTVAGPSARDALRGRLGGRALRPAAARAVRRRPRPGRRGGLRRPGGAARADGAGRLPAAPGRPPACRGRLPGRLPRPGPQGPVDPRPRAAGQLALRRGAAHGPQGPRPARSPPPDRGRRIREVFDHAVPPRRPIGRSSTASRPRCCTARSTACRGPSACRWCSATSRASPSTRRRTGCDGPVGTLRSRLARAREKLRTGLARRGVALPAAALGVVLAPRSASASVSSPPVRFHDPGRDRVRGPSRRRERGALRLRRGAGPGGPAYHAVPQAASSSR